MSIPIIKITPTKNKKVYKSYNNFHESDIEPEHFNQEIKNTTIQETIVKR